MSFDFFSVDEASGKSVGAADISLAISSSCGSSGTFSFVPFKILRSCRCVHDGFALVVVVGHHECVAGVLLNLLDAGNPGLEFVERI